MILDRVTITGADDNVAPEDLVELHKDFPFVEFGFLFSPQRQGTPRYPSDAWLNRYLHIADDNQTPLSAHLCGEHVRNLIDGKYVNCFFKPYFSRIQLNMIERMFVELNLDQLILNTVEQYPYCDVILQSKRGFERGTEIVRLNDAWSHPHYHILYDASGGKGIPIKKFPAPHPELFCGYAGGLGPDNLEDKLKELAEVAGNATVWVDMESGVRDKQDKFVVQRVRDCLGIASTYVNEL